MSRRRQPAGEPAAHQDDVLIIGAGISGINMAYQLQTKKPHLSFTILEARADIGGTWDQFRYPGVTSDADMYTYGFPWHPWRNKLYGKGDQLKSYLQEIISTYGLDKTLKLRHKVEAAAWSSETQRWTIRANHDGQLQIYVVKWLVLGPGYFDYNTPLPAVIPGINSFKGKVIHPQFWPTDYDYKDKKIVIVGSGATAISLFPALVENGATVTLLQRSPSYVTNIPNPELKSGLAKVLPVAVSNWLGRMQWLQIGALFAYLCANFPSMMRNFNLGEMRKQLPAKTSADPHFTPRYNPWEQRMGFCRDGDFFRALHSDRADVVTATIRTVTADGIELDDGTTLDAVDVIVTATGLKVHFAGGIPISVDGKETAWNSKLLWQGCMVQDVPNLFFNWGYTNAAWTVGALATSTIACRLLDYTQRQGVSVAVPRVPEGFETVKQPLWKLSSTYLAAAEPTLPKCGSDGPWRPRRHPVLDLVHAHFGNVTNGLQFLS